MLVFPDLNTNGWFKRRYERLDTETKYRREKASSSELVWIEGNGKQAKAPILYSPCSAFDLPHGNLEYRHFPLSQNIIHKHNEVILVDRWPKDYKETKKKFKWFVIFYIFQVSSFTQNGQGWDFIPKVTQLKTMYNIIKTHPLNQTCRVRLQENA